MPPKPPAAAAAAAAGAKTKTTATKKKSETSSIDDLAFPRSLVTRLAKSVLPANAAIQRLALDALSQSATVFVNFVCATANDIAHRDGRKGIAAADILAALKLLEFGDFAPRIGAELELFVRAEAARKVAPKGKGKGKDDATLQPAEDAEAAPVAKKARVDAPGDLDGVATRDMPESESEDDDVDDADEASEDDAVVSDDEPEDAVEAQGDTDKDELDDGRDTAEEGVDDALDDGALSD